MNKLIRRIKFNYHWAMAERAMKNNNKKKFKKHSVSIRKLILE